MNDSFFIILPLKNNPPAFLIKQGDIYYQIS